MISPKQGTKAFEKAPKLVWILLGFLKIFLTPLLVVEHLTFGPGSHLKKEEKQNKNCKKEKRQTLLFNNLVEIPKYANSSFSIFAFATPILM